MRIPASLMVVVAAALALGIVGMHSALAVPAGSPQGTSPSAMATETPIHADAAHAPDSDGSDGGHHGALNGSHCGGLMAVCFMLLVGLGAFLMVRRGRLHRILWRLPAPHLLTLGFASSSFEPLSPLRRTCILRC